MYTQAIKQQFDNDVAPYITEKSPPKSFREEKFAEPFIFIPSDTGLMVSESEYWDTYYHDSEIRYEWNNGILETKDMPTYMSIVCVDFLLDCIKQFLISNPIATLVTYEFGFKIDIQNKRKIRRPDYAVILKSNPIQMAPDDYSYSGTYDICIELLSDTKKQYITKDTVTRKKEYAYANVPEYYIIDINQKKHTAFYRLNQYGTYEKIKSKNGVIQSTVLPGFQFRMNDIYRRPNLIDLMDDDVYKHYMLINSQRDRQEKKQALQEKERALQEKERALQEKDSERIAKENAYKHLENERIEKENALKEIERLKKAMKS